MPPLTRWLIRSAFLYLVLATALALLLALRTVVDMPAFVGLLNPVFFHLFLVGWVTQMIFGVAYWLFPILTRQNPRGNERLAWAAFALLNAGLLLRAGVEPWVAARGQGGPGWLLALSAALQWLAALLFVRLLWPRVRDRYRGE